MTDKTDRVMIFIDGSNLYHLAIDMITHSFKNNCGVAILRLRV